MRLLSVLPFLAFAAPAFAGDQHVITVYPEVTYYTTEVSHTFDNKAIVGGSGNDSLSAPVQATSVNGRVVALGGMSQSESDVLYAKLLAEAKARKLR